ncbi:MAG: transketolase, partial [Nitrospinota bacterium]
MTKDIKKLQSIATEVRVNILKMLTEAGSGHAGGSLSAVEILTTLYFSKMRHNPKNPYWEDRDKFVLSKGHGAPVLYAVLGLSGYFSTDHFGTLRKLGSILRGHPNSITTPGVEVCTGSLGQ